MPRLLPISIVLLAASSFVSAQTYTVLHNFGSAPGDPSHPGHAMIAQSRDGAMLTTTSKVAFRIWTDGSLQVLRQLNLPYGGLILATDGKFYGTTYTGGTFSYGTVFKMSEDGSATTLHNFTGGVDGKNSQAAPIQSVEGDFYGTTSGDFNSRSGGTVYRITKYGNFTLPHTFTAAYGAAPSRELVQGTDYYLYGTTEVGGESDYGTIFRISRSGDFKVLVNFDGTHGNYPNAGLIQGNDGNFYGVTTWGGTSDAGVIFRMTPHGAFAVLHSFTGGSDGAHPLGGLMQASDGNLYGTSTTGGKNGRGVLFRATLAGDVVALHDFDDATGFSPEGTLFQHTNGKLYGVTYGGGTVGMGVFFSLDSGLPPFVTYLPTYGRAGALVQILGQGFTSGSMVFFNGVPAASPLVVYPTYLRVIVPSGATTGPITVTTSTGTLTSNKVFIVHPN